MTVQMLRTPRPARLLPCERNPRLWFSDRPSEVEAAKWMCQPCPQREACLAGALDRQEAAGVWGGELLEHGTVLAFKRGRGRPPRAEHPEAS